MSQSGDWYNLSKEQRADVDALRERITQNMIAETEAFYKVHPEIQVTWSVTLDGFTRTSAGVMTINEARAEMGLPPASR